MVIANFIFGSQLVLLICILGNAKIFTFILRNAFEIFDVHYVRVRLMLHLNDDWLDEGSIC